MAQSGYTPIQLYRTTTGGAAPVAGNLAAGELAINYNDADMALYAENASGVVKRVINNPAGLKYPTSDGSANQVVATDGAGNLSFATVSFGNATRLTSNTTVAAGAVVLADSNGGAFTVTLPATPASGNQVVVTRRGGNDVTIGRNGSTIEGAASDWVLAEDRLSVSFIFDGTTWRRFHRQWDVVTDKGTVTSGTTTFNFANGKKQKVTVGGNVTFAFSGAGGNEYSELFLQVVNGGAYTITWPTVTWIVGDGTTSSSFSAMGVVLQSSGTNHVYIWTYDGSTYFGKAI